MLTEEQKTALKAEIDTNHAGRGSDLIAMSLNAAGSALQEGWKVIPLTDQKIKLSRLALLTYLTSGQRAGIRAMLAGTSEAEQDFKMLFEADDEYWVNDLTFRSMLDTLGVALSIDSDVITTIKRLGERHVTRADELIGRFVTVEDIEEAL